MMDIALHTVNSFAFFSANMTKLMPEVPVEHHPRYFTGTRDHQRLVLDSGFNRAGVRQLGEAPVLREILKEPGIIATFHIGAYRLLATWFIHRRIPLTLLVTAGRAAAETRNHQAAVEQLEGDGDPAAFDLLQAEDPMVMRKLVRAMESGYYVLAFLDGNQGVERPVHVPCRQDLEVPFLAHRLRVKTGIAELAYLTGRPVYPLAVLRTDGGELAPVSMQPLVRPSDAVRSEFVRHTMQNLYGWLAELVARHPMQWEGWFYVHHDLPLDQPASLESLARQFLPLAMGDRYFLLHRVTYGAYPLPETAFRKMCYFYFNEMLK